MSVNYDKSKTRVLVCDDEESIRSMIVETLKTDGWSVDSAENGKEGLEKHKKQPAHIILSDINMPELSGTEFLEEVKKINAQTEFIIMTSHATLETAMKAVELGAFDYLQKPFDDLAVVLKKIEQVAERVFLRQQNQELLKRLKVVGKDLKRLLGSVSPLTSILEISELREKVPGLLKQLIDEEDFQSVWAFWDDDSEKWAFGDSHFDSWEDLEASLKETTKEWNKEELSSKEVLFFTGQRPHLAAIFVNHLKTCFEKVINYQEVASLATQDGLTKLYNHRYFQERLQQEVSLALRNKSQASLLLLDVDYFKNYNDTNGHPAGDKLLVQLAELLSSHGDTNKDTPVMKRVSDIVARYGGEEFVMILPFTPYDGAIIKAERICEAVRSFGFEHAESQPEGKISVSVGVATCPDQTKAPKELIQFADKALYQAKESGRDQVFGALNLSSESKSEPMDEPVAEAEQNETGSTLGSILDDDSAEEIELTPLEEDDESESLPAGNESENSAPSESEDFDVMQIVNSIHQAYEQGENGASSSPDKASLEEMIEGLSKEEKN